MSQTDQQRQDSLIVLSIVLTTLSSKANPQVSHVIRRWQSLRMLTFRVPAFIVAVRSLIRFVIVRKPGYDEYTIIVALFFTIGYMIELLILRGNHVGFPASTLTIDNMLGILQTTLAIEVTYYLIIGFIKTSILCTYLRFGMLNRFLDPNHSY